MREMQCSQEFLQLLRERLLRRRLNQPLQRLQEQARFSEAGGDATGRAQQGVGGHRL
jgi:hypothetical protein